ncbi:MAG: GNAT family N-acetyltransferase [Nitrospiraceae bacterium]|nr:GNAT family N-acetyltransferase [Nitrospiraceae bacterium]
MKLTVRLLQWRDLTPSRLSAWADLESRAIDPNAYLSPHFVLPAQRYLSGHTEPIIMWIEEEGTAGHELMGVGIFEMAQATRRFPFAHLRAFRSRHSYLSGLLLDSTAAREAIEAWIAYCRGKAFQWHGIDFGCWPADGKSEQLVRSIAPQHGATWQEYERMPRAVLYPQQAGESYVESHLSTHRRKDLRRCMRRLGEIGPVAWTFLQGTTFDEACVDRFLELEQAGWKGEQGDALISDGRDEQFFREMVRGFAGAGRAIFTELRVGERVVSSTCNFVSGRACFAFKIGWHRDFAKMSPGILNEVELMRQAPSMSKDLDFFDSGASQGSYIDELWGERRQLSNAILVTTPAGRAMLGAIDLGRQVKRRLLG